LLRIQADRLPRRDSKKLRIKQVNIIDESAPARRILAYRIHSCGGRCGMLPAVARNLRDRVHGAIQELPEGIRISNSTRQAAADADYCNWLHGLTRELRGRNSGGRKNGRCRGAIGHPGTSFTPVSPTEAWVRPWAEGTGAGAGSASAISRTAHSRS